MLRKLKIKYYFWKLKRNKIDLQTVALKLSVPTGKVKEEYDRYINPFKQIKIEPFVSFVAVCVSVCSIFIAVETLNEMRRERDLTYKPDLRVYENDISLYWNEEGRETRREDNYSRQYQSDEENVLYGVYLNIDNIGAGNAKDIKYDWNYEDNLRTFNSFLEKSGVEAFFDETENLIEIDYKDEWVSWTRIDENDMESYISQDTQKRVLIPSVYLELLTAYCYEKLPPSSEIEYTQPLTMHDFPKLSLTISYKDIQGLETQKKVEIGLEPTAYNKEDTGEGNCSWRVRNLGEEIINE
nr:hypothetical protein [uncultured Mediterraneibacter sp.]